MARSAARAAWAAAVAAAEAAVVAAWAASAAAEAAAEEQLADVVRVLKGIDEAAPGGSGQQQKRSRDGMDYKQSIDGGLREAHCSA